MAVNSKAKAKRNAPNGAPHIQWADRDRQAALFAMWGFTNRFIEAKTGLSSGQIGYRLKRLGLQHARYEYRNGEGEVATQLMARRMEIARPVLQRHLAPLLPRR